MRQPDVIFGSILIPIIFVVLFGYVFGGSIKIPGGNYRSYLMPGLFGQAILFGSNSVAVGIATDMSEGVIDRFKTLPIGRSAIVIGRAVSALLLGIPAMVVMILCALAVGWRPTGGLGNALLAFGLYELFGFAAIWLGILVGLLAQSSQAADVIMGIPTFLLGFISNVFVDPANMPAWLRVFAEWNPMSAMVTPARRITSRLASLMPCTALRKISWPSKSQLVCPKRTPRLAYMVPMPRTRRICRASA